MLVKNTCGNQEDYSVIPAIASALYPLQSSGEMKTDMGPGDYKQAVAIGVCSSHVDGAQDGGLFLQVPSKTLSERERN